MKYLTLLFLPLFCCGLATGQEAFWQEDFGQGCNQGQEAASVPMTTGIWSITNTGNNESLANVWYISATENGEGEGNCGGSCGNNRTLHIGNVDINFLIQIPADGGATYYASGAEGFCDLLGCSATNKRVESPTINCSGRENITLSFDYLEGGNALDNATLYYYDGEVWVLLADMAKTACCGGPCNGTNQGIWTSFNIDLPVSANDNSSVKIGFNWTNNDDIVATDPSIAVDNVSVSGTMIDTTEPCLGDFDNDGIVNAADLLILLSAPTDGCPEPCVFDLDNSGVYDTADLLVFLTVFGSICD
ncbi:MAG: hypothetical protein AAF193_04835 [Bacteroidota bacterium]